MSAAAALASAALMPGAGICSSSLTSDPFYAGPRCLPAPDLTLTDGSRVLRPRWTGTLGPAVGGWQQRQHVSSGLRLVRAPGAPGRRVALFTVGPGDSPVAGGERAEVAASRAATGGNEGTIAWYAWSTRFARRLNPLRDSTWNIFMQWHGTGRDHCSPNVALQINTKRRPARLRLAVRGGALNPRTCAPQQHAAWDTVVARRLRWYDFTLKVGWSPDGRRGFVQLSVDGRVVVPRTPIATLYRGQGTYLKQGLYRGPSRRTSRVYHGGVTRF